MQCEAWRSSFRTYVIVSPRRPRLSASTKNWPTSAPNSRATRRWTANRRKSMSANYSSSSSSVTIEAPPISTPSVLTKNMITNASFRTKKLECDIPRVESEEDSANLNQGLPLGGCAVGRPQRLSCPYCLRHCLQCAAGVGAWALRVRHLKVLMVPYKMP